MNKEIGLPIGASNVRAYYKGVEYPIDSSTIHTRTGEQGTHPVVCLFKREKFEGEILDGSWRKSWTSAMGGSNDPFVAKITTTNGLLEMSGESSADNTNAYGAIANKNPILMVEDGEIVVELEVPTSAAQPAFRVVDFGFFLNKESVEDNTRIDADENFLGFLLNVTDAGILAIVYKRINDVSTTLWDGSTKDGNTTGAIGGNTFWKFKIVFDGKPGTSGAEMTVYAKTGSSRANMEADAWEELYDTVGTQASPYDVSDLMFHIGYPLFWMLTDQTTIFDDTAPAISTGVEVTYPDFQLRWDGGHDSREADGAVQLWDGNPDSGGVLVESQDHVFTGDIYLQNGLIRLQIDELAQYGLKPYLYSSSYLSIIARYYLNLISSGIAVQYPSLKSIKTDPRNPEKITLRVRLLDSATINTDYYIDLDISLRRGCYYFEVEIADVFPTETISAQFEGTTTPRFGYGGNSIIGDDDLNTSGNNTTLSDNYMLNFDDAGNALIGFISINYKPDVGGQRFRVYEGRGLNIESISSTLIPDIVMCFGAVPFSLKANLFKEAESATISASVREYIDAAHTGFTDMSDMVTDAQPDSGETVIYEDDETFWNVAGTCTLSEETTIIKTGTSSLKIVTAAPSSAFGADYGAGNGQDWSGQDYIGFWWYNTTASGTVLVTLYDDGGGGAYFVWAFNCTWTGWQWVCLKRSDFVDVGGADWTDIRIINLFPSVSSETYYLDHFCLFDGLWTVDANATVIINDTASKSVGTYCTKITSVGAGNVEDYVTPISILGKVTKFDTLKFYVSGSRSSFILILWSSLGNYVYKTITSITATPTQTTVNIPHSASDLQGWTQVGTFNFSAMARIYFNWTASGGGETIVIDDFHEYIGTTTTRGRGETLSGGSAVVLDESGEYIRNTITAGTNLPSGLYLMVYRGKDTDQLGSDVRFYSYNSTDGLFRNENNNYSTKTLTSTFAYYAEPVIITDADVSGLDSLRYPQIQKLNSAENTQFIDYIVIVPLSNGRDFPMDQAHAMLTDATIKRVKKVTV